MKSVLTRAIAVALATCVASVAVAAQPTKGPRTKDGKPDLNEIWQAVNSANYDLEPHAARSERLDRNVVRIAIAVFRSVEKEVDSGGVRDDDDLRFRIHFEMIVDVAQRR